MKFDHGKAQHLVNVFLRTTGSHIVNKRETIYNLTLNIWPFLTNATKTFNLVSKKDEYMASRFLCFLDRGHVGVSANLYNLPRKRRIRCFIVILLFATLFIEQLY